MMTVYLLHFEKPISEAHTTQHYLGFAEELAPRLNAHRFGRGARLTQVAIEKRIGWELARAWEGNRADEKRLKAYKNSPRFCPFCNDNPVNPAGLKEIIH